MAVRPTMVGYYVERELRIYKRLWRASAFSGVLGPVMFLGAMGLGLGGLVDEQTADVEGLDYLAFVTPGLLVASAMVTGTAEALWPVMTGMKWTRTYHAMVSSPLRPAEVLAGHLTWVGMRVVMQATIFVTVAASLGAIDSPWAVCAVPVAVLTALAFCAPVAAFVATRESDVSFSLIMRLGVTPLFLFSGTFFPIEELPDGVQPLAVLSPLFHGVEVARAATTGSGDTLAVLGHVAVLVMIVFGFFLVGARTYAGRLVS